MANLFHIFLPLCCFFAPPQGHRITQFVCGSKRVPDSGSVYCQIFCLFTINYCLIYFRKWPGHFLMLYDTISLVMLKNSASNFLRSCLQFLRAITILRQTYVMMQIINTFCHLACFRSTITTYQIVNHVSISEYTSSTLVVFFIP